MKIKFLCFFISTRTKQISVQNLVERQSNVIHAFSRSHIIVNYLIFKMLEMGVIEDHEPMVEL